MPIYLPIAELSVDVFFLPGIGAAIGFIGETTTRFTVRAQGFERYVANLARSNPVLYGLATILIALGTGWLGGVLFKR